MLSKNRRKENYGSKSTEKLYDFTNEGAINRFWANIDFSEVKPVANVYEGLETIVDERERNIRQSLRSWRARRQ